MEDAFPTRCNPATRGKPRPPQSGIKFPHSISIPSRVGLVRRDKGRLHKHEDLPTAIRLPLLVVGCEGGNKTGLFAAQPNLGSGALGVEFGEDDPVLSPFAFALQPDMIPGVRGGFLLKPQINMLARTGDGRLHSQRLTHITSLECCRYFEQG